MAIHRCTTSWEITEKTKEKGVEIGSVSPPIDPTIMGALLKSVSII